ncbi:MAG: hypothetical protein ACTSRZ_16265 [Promethearchaeota archaeon]
MGETEQEEKNKIVIYQFNDELAEFEELELEEGIKLYELLDPAFVLLFVDVEHYKAYIWQGAETSTRMKFLSAKMASFVKDDFGPAFHIVTEDDGSESLAFKILVGLEEPIKYDEQDLGPSYTGTEEDLELINLADREKIILILEKVELPEEYAREMVIVNNKIYKYHTYEIEYNGAMVETKELLPLEEEVPDGPYLAEGYTPRILFSFNKIILIELLRKMTPEEIADKKAKEKAREEYNKKLLETQKDLVDAKM